MSLKYEPASEPMHIFVKWYISHQTTMNRSYVNYWIIAQ